MSLCRTTFIQNLLGPYAQQPDLAVNGVRGPEALRTFEHAPEKMATTVEVQDNNSLTNFFYSVQDTPGQPLFCSFEMSHPGYAGYGVWLSPQ